MGHFCRPCFYIIFTHLLTVISCRWTRTRVKIPLYHSISDLMWQFPFYLIEHYSQCLRPWQREAGFTRTSADKCWRIKYTVTVILSHSVKQLNWDFKKWFCSLLTFLSSAFAVKWQWHFFWAHFYCTISNIKNKKILLQIKKHIQFALWTISADESRKSA